MGDLCRETLDVRYSLYNLCGHIAVSGNHCKTFLTNYYNSHKNIVYT